MDKDRLNGLTDSQRVQKELYTKQIQVFLPTEPGQQCPQAVLLPSVARSLTTPTWTPRRRQEREPSLDIISRTLSEQTHGDHRSTDQLLGKVEKLDLEKSIKTWCQTVKKKCFTWKQMG